jgi:hypothetical protein
MSPPDAALRHLAEQLRDEDSVISPHVTDPGDEDPALGLLAAAGPRAVEAPDEYALLIETIREGYLLHYGKPRVVTGVDPDLALLAGDYLYARGLERLAALGDLEGVRELSDLISLSAQLHAEDGASGEAAGALWLASVTCVTVGATADHERAKAALRAGDPSAPESLLQAAHSAAPEGLLAALGRAADDVGLSNFQDLRDLG